MSCDGNRKKFTEACMAPGTAGAAAFGTAEQAQAVMEAVFEQGRANAATRDPAQQVLAEAQTRALFAQMRRMGITPPTHSANGLPKKDAQFGYAAMQRTLAALEHGTPLPAETVRIARAQGNRQLTGQRFDARALIDRCTTCGRFSNTAKRAHLCPATTDSPTMQRALVRRLSVPASAYPTGALANLMAQARADGTVTMRHSITGEPVAVTLDGLIPALTQGFQPTAWDAVTVLAATTDGRVVPVFDATGMTDVERPATALVAAAVGSGVVLDESTPVVDPTASSLASTASPIGPVEVSLGEVSLTGGKSYDANHFIGSEYRKRGIVGTPVTIGPESYTVGARHGSEHYSSARRAGYGAKETPGGKPITVGVGRTLPGAIDILMHPRVEVSEVPGPGGRIEVSLDGGLVGVYDPATRTAGSTDGATSASSGALAAVLAHRLRRPEREQDELFARDLDAATTGRGSGLAAADGAYLAITATLDDSPLTLGAAVGAARCPDCGQWRGVSHACPTSKAMPEPAPIPVATAPESVPAPAPEPVAGAVEPVAIRPEPAPAPEPVAVSAEAVAAAAAAAATEAAMGRMLDVFDRFAARLDAPAPARRALRPAGMRGKRATGDAATPESAMTPMPTRVARPRPDRPVPTGTMTEQERIVSKLRLKRPDPTLAAVDPKLLPTDFTALDEEIPGINPDFVMNEASRRILTNMVNTINAGQQLGKVERTRSFGIFGPPGTGKNELPKQLAASIITVDADGTERQGMPLYQVEFGKEMDVEAEIGTTVITPEGTKAQLGGLGLAAAQGSVICINEVVRNPKMLTELQPMLEEGVIRLRSTEAGVVTIPVHPSTVFVLTWNPGMDGDADRPGGAGLARIKTYELPRPSLGEQEARVKSFFARATGDLKPSDAEVRAAVALFNTVARSIESGDLQRRGRGSRVAPGPRELEQFVLTGKTDGWVQALEHLKVYCDLNPEDKEKDWKFLEEQFGMLFGADGNAHARTSPKRSS